MRVREKEAATALEVTAGGRVRERERGRGREGGREREERSASEALSVLCVAVQCGGGHRAYWEAAAGERGPPSTLYHYTPQQDILSLHPRWQSQEGPETGIHV